MQRYKTLLTVQILLPLLFAFETASALAGGAEEATVKAAFIFNFFKFIDWPEEMANSDSFILCTNDEGVVSDKLMELQGRELNGKKLKVRKNIQSQALLKCNMVYLVDAHEYSTTLKVVQSLPIVTVGDGSNFVNQGGMISFVPNDSHLGFEVNQELALALHIRINAQLLKLAKFVKLAK